MMPFHDFAVFPCTPPPKKNLHSDFFPLALSCLWVLSQSDTRNVPLWKRKLFFWVWIMWQRWTAIFCLCCLRKDLVPRGKRATETESEGSIKRDVRRRKTKSYVCFATVCTEKMSGGRSSLLPNNSANILKSTTTLMSMLPLPSQFRVTQCLSTIYTHVPLHINF